MKIKKTSFSHSDEALELIAARFKLLAEPARLKLLMNLQTGRKTVSELVEASGLSQPNVSRHVAKLADGGILNRKKEGLNVYYGIADPSIYQLCQGVCGNLKKNLEEKGRAFD